MKQTILLLTFFCSVASVAQNKQISVSFDSPSTGSSIYAGVDFDIVTTITNSGTVDILPDDSIFVTLTINGQNALPGFYLATREDPLNPNQQSTFLPGDSYSYTFDALSIPTISETSTEDVCVRAVLMEDNDGAPIDDQQDCISLIFDADGSQVGIDQFSKENLDVYPNPAKNQVSINIQSNASMQILTTTGEMVKIKNLTKGNNSIDISNLSPGIYLYNIKKENSYKVITGKLVVE